MSELFSPEELAKPHPKIEWMKRNGIVVGIDKTDRVIDGEFVERPILCCHTIVLHAKTEEEALLLMARKMGVKHYTEEEFERSKQPTWEE